jgi:peptide/nickel transport system substrate-binding protein
MRKVVEEEVSNHASRNTHNKLATPREEGKVHVLKSLKLSFGASPRPFGASQRSSRRLTSMSRLLVVSLLALALALLVSACGSSSSSKGGTVTVLMGTPPDSLDPGVAASLQSAEATWIAYTGLVTYAHASGEAGTKLIPGVAQALPVVSNGGRTYSFTLRKGLVYSNGAPLHASDFAHAVERAIRLNWGGKGMLIENIAGAEAFDKHKASSISGIHSSDAAGTVTIELNAPAGTFSNVLAFPAIAPVPSSTPMTALPNDPPPGVGPYRIASVVPNRSFSLLRNPYWARDAIPGIPSGSVNVNVQVVSNNQTEAEQVLNGSADLFDANDSVPPTLLAQIESQAAGRFAKEQTATTEFFFLNVKAKPFSSALVREAVNYAVDRRALQRLASGMLKPACFFIPAGVPGHPTGPCPYGEPNGEPNLAKARELVKQSGMAGSEVTVWGGTRPPHKEFVDYFASVLGSIGLKASVKVVADAQYFATIGNLSNNPQTGWLAFSEDFPHPADFYQLLNAHSILPQENHNLSQVDDPHIQSEIEALSPVPSSQLESVVGRWQALDEYTARNAYVAVFGYDEVPKLTSSRIDFGALVFHPVYGTDWSTLKLK